ncbi:hypothetical protein H072_3370 [Dactylellina haptotyla CBS 200.50]|uniref:Uncharacterized protein n=1 Tax=Dactylellina haptotyla (strain CBS 200.50) TaxID=1284197 RepID=S8AI77_DACHA|nr:hypothetical protein H072_3370 [Dactylellina haptotyla CBS 200.50]
MSTKTAYSSNNVLAHRDPVNLPHGVNVTENTTILVRLAPDTVTLDIPFNRVTTWNRLIQTIYEIYLRNNPSSCQLTLEDALHYIQIKNDRTGGLILPELWPDFIKPQVRIAAVFNGPFLSPPWNLGCELIKREEEDTDMMDNTVSCVIEPKFGGYIEAADWRKPNRLIGPALNKHEDSEYFHLLPAPLLPTSFTFTPSFTTAWAPMQSEKSHLRHPANMNGSSFVSEVFAESLLVPRAVSQEPMAEAMRDTSMSPPPPVTFRNPFPASNLTGSSPSQATPLNIPQRFTPIRQVPASDVRSRTESYSPECSHQAKELNQRPIKRKREDDSRMDLLEPSRKSKSPFHSSESNGSLSRSHSVDIDPPLSARRLATPVSSRTRKSSDANSNKTVVLHQKILLLDAINAGEMVKIIKTKDGDLIAIRDDEEPEEFMERRESNASIISLPPKKEKGLEVSKTARKRAIDEAQTEELVRIWSGGGPEPPAKRTRANHYDKLSVDQKHKIAKFVHEQHIIRIDHFTNPVIQEWKTRTIPEADLKQTEDYISEIASNKYSDNAKRKEAYRLFMEHHNHSHKSSPLLSAHPKP